MLLYQERIQRAVCVQMRCPFKERERMSCSVCGRERGKRETCERFPREREECVQREEVRKETEVNLRKYHKRAERSCNVKQ